MSPQPSAPSTELRIPEHVAIIMDGNGRWAKQRGLPRTDGHIRGQDALRATLRAAAEFGIRYLTVYAFSTENWSRPQEEVDALMSLLDSLRDPKPHRGGRPSGGHWQSQSSTRGRSAGPP